MPQRVCLISGPDTFPGKEMSLTYRQRASTSPTSDNNGQPKKNGTVKTRACADGRKQRLYISKEESTSPTIHLESILITFLINAAEGRDIATADITGAYLFVSMKDFVLIKLVGKSVEIMCETNPTYLE